MNDDPRPDEVFEIEPSDDGGIFAHLPWWLIFAVAFVVTELTAHPSIGVSVLCMKFGWNDFRTSLWLRHRDPNRRRGAVCSWFYLSSGLWRVCLWSCGLMFVAIMFLVANEAPRAGPAGRPNADPVLSLEAMTCLIMWISSFAAATLLTILSAVIAWRHRVKVWISKRVSESRRHNEWPPLPTPNQRLDQNLLNWWLVGSGIGLFVGLFVGGIFLVFAVLDTLIPQPRIANNGGGGVELFAGLFGAGTPIISAILIIFVGGRILERIGANSPGECWPLEEWFAETNPSD